MAIVKRRSTRILIWSVGLPIVAFGLFLATMWAREWQPEAIEDMTTHSLAADTLPASDTITILSWNIGYAGLGDDMDFFMDGGKSMRTGEERTRENLRRIISTLEEYRSADFILLQEVDFDSRRSYHINEYDSIRAALPEFMGWWGLNYVADFVPVPITNPMGAVRSGVVTLSRWAPTEVLRLQYPGSFGLLTRIFNLKRCMLTASFEVRGSGNMLYINNTHNSAYDSGDMRRQEIDYMRRYLTGKPMSITMGDWNSTPPGYTASEAALTDKHFVPHAIAREDFGSEYSFVYDANTPSVRYGYEPYRSGVTTITLLDFALVGAGVTPLSVEVLDLGFESSDHNPVVARFRINSRF